MVSLSHVIVYDAPRGLHPRNEYYVLFKRKRKWEDKMKAEKEDVEWTIAQYKSSKKVTYKLVV